MPGTTPRVLLAFPYRDHDGSRFAPFKRTVEIYRSYGLFSSVVAVDSGHEQFNRGASRNLAFQYAEENEFDVVVCNDADSVCQSDALKSAIEAAATSDRFQHPFDMCYEMVPKALGTIGTRPPSVERNRAYSKTRSQGGSWCTTPYLWFKAGGQDPRFPDWGCEDRAFIPAVETLVGPSQFHEGELFSLYHDRSQRQWEYNQVQLMIRYQDAIGDPKTMLGIIGERLLETYADSYRTVPWAAEERGPVVRVISGNLQSP